ncbi:MAG TPA: glycosyltransferase family 2 protein [Draconibacterium sp.]|nr:glycosyltransferase family 2 protein [Draconibacterium sp.]
MSYIAWFVLIFTLLQFSVAFVNLLFLQRFPKSKKYSNQLVSVLIPARNEEKNIGNLLSCLQKQDYMNIEIIVFNDQSTDKTTNIVKGFAESDKRIKLINSEGLPDKWLGKNHACFSLAKHATGKYLLFLDADVKIGNNIIQQTTHFTEKYKLGLLSVFPKQIMKTLGEEITVPNMNYILLSLLPLILVRKINFSSIAAANGQFMLFQSEIYHKFQPHEKMKTSKVEDIKIARYLKKNKIKVACLTGNSSITCHMYNGFSEAIYGFSKNVAQFFGGSFILAILFWLVTSLGFIAVLFSFSISLFLLYLSAVILTRVFISVTSNQSVFRNLLLAVPQQITMGIFILQSIINTFKRQYTWKERNIYS